MNTLCVFILFALSLFISTGLPAEDRIRFNRDIRPIISDNCFACHGFDSNKRKANLRLDMFDESLFKQKILVPGLPNQSLLYQRITKKTHKDLMPPHKTGKSLTYNQKNKIRDWIKQGAKYEGHWAYTPVRRPKIPKVQNIKWPRNAIDSFILAALEANQLQPSKPSPSHILTRRLYFDLIGLPPSIDNQQDFTEKNSLDISRLVDDLLSRPQFGERMAINWLDLVRYGDSNGYHADIEWSVFPYRDYVITAFNENRPFNKFTREQIAGDLLPNASLQQKIGASYNRLNMKSTEGGIQDAEYRVKYSADRVRTTSSTWLGSTLGCAECHDHKFDPFTSRDFYQFAAFFADIKQLGYYPGAQSKGWGETISVPNETQHNELKKLKLDLVKASRGLKEEEKKKNERYKKALNTLNDFTKSIPTVLATVSTKPQITRILPRGNWMDQSGEIVQPDIPGFLKNKELTKDPPRLALANWLTDKDNPLTARVFVNRLWKYFFGRGLSRVLDDFGSQGTAPTHPDLLDWLAAEFMDSDWDIKHMVRLITTSQAYRQSSKSSKMLELTDPYNQLIARQARYRLDAELVRDNALAVSGLLIQKIGGRSVKPYQPSGYWANLHFPQRTYKHDTGSAQYRRGLYTHWQRQFLHPALLAFDAPSREECTAERPRSNTPIAALVMLNDPSQIEAARVLAERILKRQILTLKDQFNALGKQVLSRPFNNQEQILLAKLLREHIEEFESNPIEANKLVSIGITPYTTEIPKVELAAWISVTRAVLNLHETITRN
ncbi:MAG: PSD1 and planctomycete cytochrome C domain-containing protein [Verrucomicrobiota bacterium]|nr:PSD1 and planctomycete cytochrome C domain-containing protein [Verrucomicrobiota bacterium]